MVAPVLHELAGEFDRIPLDIVDAGSVRVVDGREQVLQAMSIPVNTAVTAQAEVFWSLVDELRDPPKIACAVWAIAPLPKKILLSVYQTNQDVLVNGTVEEDLLRSILWKKLLQSSPSVRRIVLTLLIHFQALMTIPVFMDTVMLQMKALTMEPDLQGMSVTDVEVV